MWEGRHLPVAGSGVSSGGTFTRRHKRVYGQLCIETLHERHNGIEHLVVCLSEYLPLILKKIRMDYSCHGRYKGIQLVFGLFLMLSS